MPKRDPALKNAIMNVVNTVHCETDQVAFCAALDTSDKWHHATVTIGDRRDEVNALLGEEGNTLDGVEDALMFLAQEAVFWSVAEDFPTKG